MLFIILSILLLLIIIYLLLVPIKIFIDTSNNQYYLQLKGLAKASIEAHEQEIIKINLKVLLFNFEVFPLQKIGNNRPKVQRNISIKNKPLKKPSISTIISILKSFKVRRFKVDIDSGDCITNSKLYPLFAFLNYYRGTHLKVNFEGRNTVLLSIENRPIHIIKSFINS